jgi:hypothetical protein
MANKRAPRDPNSPTITARIDAMLMQVYPCALSYAQIFEALFPGESPEDRLNLQGGTYMRTLCKQGLARKITTGFYVHTP